MPMNYLEDLDRMINNGGALFACPIGTSNEWRLGKTIEELAKLAQKTADTRRFPIHIYRLVNKTEATKGTQFLCVRKILEQSAEGKPNFHWSLLDTIEAAETMRDVSQGPTPLFGAVIEQSFEPKK